jgi:hypothetical protein
LWQQLQRVNAAPDAASQPMCQSVKTFSSIRLRNRRAGAHGFAHHLGASRTRNGCGRQPTIAH